MICNSRCGARALLAALVHSVLLLAWPVFAQWTSVGTGIDYQKFTITMIDHSNNNVFVARMVVSNTNCIINSMIASNHVSGTLERPSAMAARCNDALNYWGQAWGQRNDVIIAVNGGFQNGTTNSIAGGDIYDGWYASRFGDWAGEMGFVWKMDRSYFIGVCPHYNASDQTVTVGAGTRVFDGINIARGADQLILYTPQYNNNTLTDGSGVEVVVQLSTPLMLLTPPGTVTGTITQVRNSQGSTLIPFDTLVLSGVGSGASFLQTYATVGQSVSISENLQLYDGPNSSNLCSVVDNRSFDKPYGLAQGNYEFLKNGVIQATDNSGMIIRNPRTFVAYNATYVYFAVCDGRTTASVGMTSDEMGAFCVNYLAATYGCNQDGGGSSVMVVNGVIQNSPSDGSERAVVNGLMMVNVQPKLVSTALSVGQTITTTGSANLRLGPGTDYFGFASVANGAQGTVVSHAINGVYAKGYYWWKCNFSGTTGWIAESALIGTPAITQQPTNQTVVAGGTASFTVLASGTSPLSYQWQKNTVNLSNSGHYFGSTTGTLTVTNADSTDAASYRCVVTNTYGSVTSSPATLATTNGFPPNITQQPTSQSVAAGGTASFAVLASGTGSLSYQWQKNQVNLADGGHNSGSTTGTLTVTNADSTDVASYGCVVTNVYGSATSSPATLTLATNAGGAFTLTKIPALSGDTTSDARAITPDGRWVAGLSGSRGFLYGVNTTNVVNVVSSDGAQSSIVTGVGYRTNSGHQEVVLSGLSSSLFTAWMTTNGGATWGAMVRGESGTKPTVPAANGLAGSASDVFYSVWTDEGTGATDNWGLNLGRFSNSWPATVGWGQKAAAKPSALQLNSVSSNGRGVGWRQDSGVTKNYVADWAGATTPSLWYFKGLDGTTAGQAYAVSADGTIIFGLSPKGAATGSTNYGYKVVFNGTFPGAATQLSTNSLPNFPDIAGSTNVAVPYGCTADGKYAVGMNYRGLEKAVLWDTSDPNPAKWTLVDLTDLAAANGILDGFARLTRAYSVGMNGAGALVIAGAGLDTNSPANGRAFVMTVAPPLAPIAFPPTVTISGLYPAGLTCSFLSPANSSITCYLEYTTNLVPLSTWTAITSTPSTGAMTSLSDANPPDQQRFYRIRIQ